jgi:hypothetical protein
VRPKLALLLLLLGLAIAGCAQGGKTSNDDNNSNRFGGFYGGVTGGMN